MKYLQASSHHVALAEKDGLKVEIKSYLQIMLFNELPSGLTSDSGAGVVVQGREPVLGGPQ
jgi:hypothetical protein